MKEEEGLPQILVGMNARFGIIVMAATQQHRVLGAVGPALAPISNSMKVETGSRLPTQQTEAAVPPLHLRPYFRFTLGAFPLHLFPLATDAL